MWKYSELTLAQRQVVKRLREGWQLSQDVFDGSTICLHHSIKENFKVHLATHRSLLKKGVIRRVRQEYPVYYYALYYAEPY